MSRSQTVVPPAPLLGRIGHTPWEHHSQHGAPARFYSSSSELQITSHCLDVIVIVCQQSAQVFKYLHPFQLFPVRCKLYLQRPSCSHCSLVLQLLCLSFNAIRCLAMAWCRCLVCLHFAGCTSRECTLSWDADQLLGVSIIKVPPKVPFARRRANTSWDWAKVFAIDGLGGTVDLLRALNQQVFGYHLRPVDIMLCLKVAGQRASGE